MIALYGEKVAKLLNVQYRMNEKIMKWSSDAMYEGRFRSVIERETNGCS